MENHELFMHADHLLLVDETQRIILGITGDDMGSQIREGGSGGMESQPVLVLTAVSTDEIEEIPPDVDPLTSIPRDGGHEQDLTLDIDRNGRVDALTDGLMLVRYMFGYSGADVVRDAVARDGIQIDAAEITSYLDELGLVLDVDGNGELTAQTDGIMIIRALFGFSGDIVVRNVLSPGAPRDMAEVTAYLEDLLSGPEAVNDSATVELGTTGTIDVLANDTDDNNDVLEITRFSTTSSQGGAIARDRNNNSLHYTPASGFRGTDSFKYSISKGNGGTSSATVTITVPNKAPEAGSDSAIVLLGTTGIIQVLANDTDDNGDLLSVTGFSATSSSGGENARDGNSLLYTPADGFRGLDSFVYSISDGNGGIDSTTVGIWVPNEAPEAVNDEATVSLGTTGTIDVLANDTDDNNDVLEITRFSLNSEKGGKNARDRNNNNSLLYTPADGFRGTDSFEYSIDDDNDGTSSTTVTITVPNKAPEAGNDEATVELGTTGIIQVLANDTDDNNDVLEITRFSLNSEKGGKNARDRNSLHYTPAAGFRGTDSFEYSISDGNGGTDSATVTITVPNKAPEAGNDEATVELGNIGIIQVLANDTDGNGDQLSVTGMSATSSKGGTIVSANPSGNGVNMLRYTPASGFRGTDSFEYSISDGNGGTDSATVTITVPNKAPEAVNDEATVELGNIGIIEVLANDTDINSDVLSVTSFSTTSSLGGKNARDRNSLHYTPAAGFRGTDSFEYSISDGNGGTDSATVTITVPNRAPEAVNDEATVELGQITRIEVLANDTDGNGDQLSITGFPTISSQGNTISETINSDDDSLLFFSIKPEGFRGIDSFVYSIEDGNGGSSSATVTITIPNKAPSAVNDSTIVSLGTTGIIEVLANDTDDNSDVLSVTSFSQNSDRGGTIAREGNSLHYTPAAGFHGTDSFEYSISDGNGGTDSATVMITVPNVPPDAIDDSATVSLQTAGIIRVLANDTDINHHDVLEITGFSTTSSKGSTINSDGNVLIYTPNSIGGIDSFMYSISDGNGGTSSATVTITVPNVPPDAIDDSTIVLVGTTGIIQVLENDIDANNDVLEITGFSTTSSLGGTIAREGNNLIYIPSNNTGMEILSYTITDNNGGTSSATVTIMVIPAE